jgi:peptidoglycan hydrolase-like protein with peptidoglycan-binding domain
MGSHEESTRPWRVSEVWLMAALCVALVAVAAGGVALAFHSHVAGPSSDAGASTKPAVAPLSVLGTSPTANETGVASSATVTVELSTALAARSPMPTFSPPVAGSWYRITPDVLQFSAAGPFVPGTSESLVIPGGGLGLFATDGQRLPQTVTVPFTVAPPSTLRLQQLLAQLGYLPVAFAPPTPTPPTQEAEVQSGTFTWRWPLLPSSLTSQWVPGTYGVITKGAVMRFETTHTLTVDGLAGPTVWSDLLAAAISGSGDPDPYDDVDVTKTAPETVHVYENGALVYTTPANTGVAAAPTATGTFPVFEHVQSATMTGTNPTGSHYVDPGIPWVSYFNGGDALHGYVRASYGFPQSDGCVEMPPANAAVVWPLTPLGTLVTVE